MKKAPPFYERRPLVCVAACFGAGVFLGARAAWHPIVWAGGLLCACFLLLTLYLTHQKMIFGVCAVFLFSGMLWAGYAAHPDLPPEGTYRVSGIVTGEVRVEEKTHVKTYLRDCVLTDEAGNLYTLPKMYWSYYDYKQEIVPPSDGQSVTFTGRAYVPSGQENPYGFDFREYLLQQGVGMGVSSAKELVTDSTFSLSLSGITLRVRQMLAEKLAMLFGDEAALPTAMLLGEQSLLPDDMRASFKDAGVAHILAVSGLHVGLLVAALLLLLCLFHLSPRARWHICMIFLLLYCVLLDFSAPVFRATVLTCVVLYAHVCRQKSDSATSLAAAFLVILLFRPLDMFSASFQLSFSAVAGIVLLGGHVEKLEKRLHLRGRIADGVRVSLCATGGVLLPSATYFHTVSLIGLIVNPFVCLAIGVLLPAYALMLFMSFLPYADVWLVYPAMALSAVTKGLESVICFLGDLPFAMLHVPAPNGWVYFGVIFCAVMLSGYVALKKKMRVIASLFVVAVCAAGTVFSVNHNVRYIQLSVGSADAAVIEDDGQTVVIDTGNDGYEVCNYLLSTGRRADTLILTHLHSDHAGGLQMLLAQKVPIGRLILPDMAEEMQVDAACLQLLAEVRAQGIPIIYAGAGDMIETKRVKLRVLWPEHEKSYRGADANDFSMALYGDLDGVSMLLTGDLSGNYEHYAQMHAQVLKAAHHGSNGSTSADFLNAVQPDIVLISADGMMLPGEKTLARLQEYGASVWNTYDAGALTLEVANKKLRVSAYCAGE